MNDKDKSLLESQALSAICEEVCKLLSRADLPPDVIEKLELIQSLCRYRHDLRTDAERNAKFIS